MIRARFELRRKLQGINSDYKTRDPTDDHNCKQLDKAEEFRNLKLKQRIFQAL